MGRRYVTGNHCEIFAARQLPGPEVQSQCRAGGSSWSPGSSPSSPQDPGLDTVSQVLGRGEGGGIRGMGGGGMAEGN